MSILDVLDAFTTDEIRDIDAAAREHNTTLMEMIHDTVMEACYR